MIRSFRQTKIIFFWKYSENYFQNIFKIIQEKKNLLEKIMSQQSIHNLFQQQIFLSLVKLRRDRLLTHSLRHDFFPHKLEKPSPMKHGCLLPSQKVDNMKTINKWMYPINLFIHPSLTSFNPSLFITSLALIVFYFWVANLTYNVSSLIITMQTYELLEHGLTSFQCVSLVGIKQIFPQFAPHKNFF